MPDCTCCGAAPAVYLISPHDGLPLDDCGYCRVCYEREASRAARTRIDHAIGASRDQRGRRALKPRRRHA